MGRSDTDVANDAASLSGGVSGVALPGAHGDSGSSAYLLVPQRIKRAEADRWRRSDLWT